MSDLTRADAVAVSAAEHVVGVQVRMPQPCSEGETDRCADRFDRASARAGEVREELRHRPRVDDALGAEAQPPEEAATPRDRRHQKPAVANF